MKRYDPIEHYDQGGSGLGQMEECEDGDYVSYEYAEKLEHDLFTLTLRLMGEDKYTHSPETAEVLDRLIPVVSKAIHGSK